MHQQQWKLSVHMEFQQDTWKDTILEHPKSKTAKMERYLLQGRMLMHGYKGKQTAGSGKSDRDLTDKMKDAAKNTAMILLGAVTVLVIAGFILFVILEIRLWLLEQTLKKQYEQADMDQKITDCFETIESGNYERACGLMEKTIYGEIELELFEERTVRSFRDKLAEEAKGLAWKEKLKLRYQFQKYCM